MLFDHRYVEFLDDCVSRGVEIELKLKTVIAIVVEIKRSKSCNTQQTITGKENQQTLIQWNCDSIINTAKLFSNSYYNHGSTATKMTMGIHR